MKPVSHVRYDGEGNAVVVYVDMTSEPMSEAAAMALMPSSRDNPTHTTIALTKGEADFLCTALASLDATWDLTDLELAMVAELVRRLEAVAT